MPPREPTKNAPTKNAPTKSVSYSGGSDKGGPSSTMRPEPRPTYMETGTRKDRSYLNTKTGVQTPAPKYGAFSLKGLTSSDPANVARNRAGVENINRMEAKREMGRNKNTEGIDNREATKPPIATLPVLPKPPAAAPRTFVPAPAGYRPGIDPEHRYYQAAKPMKKGGKVKPKGKK